MVGGGVHAATNSSAPVSRRVTISSELIVTIAKLAMILPRLIAMGGLCLKVRTQCAVICPESTGGKLAFFNGRRSTISGSGSLFVLPKLTEPVGMSTESTATLL